MLTLESYRGREFIGVDELSNVAASLIERYSQEPLRGNVRLGVTPRTVRHYLSEDLLGEPTGQSGTSTIFNYGNLLRLLAVKKLLAEHWSVIKIKEFMTALDITALETLVNGALANSMQPSTSAASKMSEARSTNQRAAQIPTSDGGQARVSAIAPLAAQPPPLAALAVESARRADASSAEWIEIAPGLEIKVRRGFRAPRNDEEHERLAARFWSVINRHAAKRKPKDEE